MILKRDEQTTLIRKFLINIVEQKVEFVNSIFISAYCSLDDDKNFCLWISTTFDFSHTKITTLQRFIWTIKFYCPSSVNNKLRKDCIYRYDNKLNINSESFIRDLIQFFMLTKMTQKRHSVFWAELDTNFPPAKLFFLWAFYCSLTANEKYDATSTDSFARSFSPSEKHNLLITQVCLNVCTNKLWDFFFFIIRQIFERQRREAKRVEKKAKSSSNLIFNLTLVSIQFPEM